MNTKNHYLEIVVFVCGAIIMIFELIGSRVLAPSVGTSIYVWTSLIGVILASLSVGYYAGGWLADRRPSSLWLGSIILISSQSIALTYLLKDRIPHILTAFTTTIEIKTLVLSIILFAPASFFLGIVTPFAAKLRLKNLAQSGSTIGHLYALSTFGSIVGTFLAGFLLIPNFGTVNTLFGLSISLWCISLLLLKDSNEKIIIKVVLLLITLSVIVLSWIFSRKVPLNVVEINTKYEIYGIIKGTDVRTHKSIVNLKAGPHGVQAAIFADDTDSLVFDCMKFFRLIGHFVKNPTQALLIGGSVYTYPRNFLKQFPKARIDVVEIDPAMTQIAIEYFGFKADKRINIFHEDGRIFINRETKLYDVIFMDAFNSGSSIPFQLTTVEVAQKLFQMLQNNGAVMINTISSIEGKKGKFLQAEYLTYATVFPQVYIFPVRDKNNSSAVQNIILLALKTKEKPIFSNPDPITNSRLKNLWNKPIAKEIPILTDDFAPVEYYRKLSLAN